MKKIVLCVFLILTILQISFSQCKESSGYESSCVSSSSSDGDSGTYSSSDESSTKNKKLFREELKGHNNMVFGGGYHNSLFNHDINFRRTADIAQTTDEINQFEFGNNSGFVEILFLLPTKRLFSIGGSAHWNTVYKNVQEHERHPWHVYEPDHRGLDEMHSQYWETRSKLNTNTFLLFSDIEIFRFNEFIYTYGRLDFGFTNYIANTIVNFTDICDCKYNHVLDKQVNNSTTWGLGLGLSVGHAGLGIRSMVGYRVYNPTGVYTKDYLSNSTAELDDSKYNYNGYPERHIFFLENSQNKSYINSRKGSFFLQFGIFVRLGSRWYD